MSAHIILRGVILDMYDFGELIYQLRKDLKIRSEKYGNKGLTQKNLAGLLDKKSRRYVLDLEGGKRSFIRPTELIKLANVFELTELERKEFFLAGSGVPNTEIFRKDIGTKIQQQLISYLHEIRLPAFLTSPFSDVIAYNMIIADLYGLSIEKLEKFQTLKVPNNFIWFLLSPDSGFFELGKKSSNWDDIIISNMQFFRRASIHYRTYSYWTKLVEDVFLRDKSIAKRFEKYWNLAQQSENLDCNIGRHYQLFKEGIGSVNFLGLVTEEITTSASLYLTVYTPIDRNTSLLFAKMADQYAGFARIPVVAFFGNWPLTPNSHPRKWNYTVIY